MEIERSIQNVHLSDQQLLELIRPAFPRATKVSDRKILSGGALNTTYKVHIDGRPFVLRIYVRDRICCGVERAIHQLIDTSVSTPRLIYANEAHDPWAYAIFEFVSGEHISEVSNEFKATLSYELGSLLASIHAFKFPHAGLFGEALSIGQHFEVGSSPYFEEAFSIISKGKNVRIRLGDQLADEVVIFMQNHRDFFPIVRENICLTHSDFKPVNLLYNAQGKVFVLDWEFAHAGIGLLDFAILLRHRDQFPYHRESLVQGYKDRGGSLPEEWFRSALITDFVNTLSLLETPSERPQLFQQLKRVIQETMANWD